MSLFPGFMMPQANDASVQYLAQMLGHQVVNDILGTNTATGLDSYVFSRMMGTFNHLLLGGGLLIFAILLFVGTMNSAADGQFLGKKWDSTWTPVRLVFGILLVVPLNTGYCMGQYIILYAIFLGINFATVMWQEVINDVFNNQDTPPPPTYLTASIQQSMADAMNSVAIPLIIQKSGLSISGSGGGAIQSIPVPVQKYLITSPSIPSSLLNDIKVDAQGMCGGLFKSYISSCENAVGNALTGPNPNTDSSLADVTSYAAIGSNPTQTPNSAYAADPYIGSYASGITSNPWSGADGAVSVYGAYVYDPAFITDTIGMVNVCPPGTKEGSPSCVLGPSAEAGQGALEAYLNLTTVVGNAVTTPASGVTPGSGGANGKLSDADAKALLGVCNTQLPVTGTSSISTSTNGIVSLNSLPSGTVSPCDMQSAIQSIIVGSQLYAQAIALNSAVPGADPNGPNPPCQSSSTPDPSCSPSQQGQQGVANNSYKYQDADGNWHIGYNLNDYWIPDINNQQYFDLQLNNSWWEAGSSYLVIDNQMSQNLNWMAQGLALELSLFDKAFNGGGSVGGQSKLNYSCNGPNQKFTPDTTAADLSGFLTPEFCKNYGIQVMEYSSSVENVSGQPLAAQYDTSNTRDGYSIPPLTPPCSNYYYTLADGTKVTYYTCAVDQVRASQQLMRDDHYNDSNVGISQASWNAMIAPYAPPSNSSGTVTVDVDTSATPMFYQELQNMPATLQGPIYVLLTIATKAGTTADPYAGYIQVYPYLVTLVGALQYNGALSQGPVQSSLPVTQTINFIFNQLIGGHSGIGSAGQAQSAASAVNTVMQQVYNLGIVDTNHGVVAAQFSLIQQAQTVGISMIMACISSMDAVFSTYTTTLQNMVNTVNQEAASAQKAADFSILSSFIPIFGPILGAIGENDMRNMSLAIMTTVTTTMTSIAVQLMWLPLFMFIMTSLFVAGVQFSILVPLMPYILFWGGSIAWFIGVLEAVVAAPLVMLGLAHPGGNDYLGHSAPAVRMLIGVMFRPVLMVIGMIVGIMLTYIVIIFSAQGFHIVAAGILNAVPTSASDVQGVMACLMLFIYATFLVMAFEKCFSPIYLLPEKVVEYIGGVAAKGGEQDLQRISGATDKVAGQAASAGGDTLNKGLDAKGKQAEGATKISQQTAQTHYDDVKADAGAVKQSMQEAAQDVGQLAKLMG